MRLQIFRSLWTTGFDLGSALADCRGGDARLFDGVEGPVPEDANARAEFQKQLASAGVPFIAEITTAGGYVPVRSATPDQHLDDLQRKLNASLTCTPVHVTVLAGCDAWPLAQSVEFFGRALDALKGCGVGVSFETHRSRSTFHPWITAEILRQLPGLRLTCDFSHWCCVCERLVMDTEPEVLALCASRADHIHARVGYDQGAQVPHPAAPEYRDALEAHERWWDAIWEAHLNARRRITTMTAEFGPDGYLHTLPFTNVPVASLDEVNRWIARRQRERFLECCGKSRACGTRHRFAGGKAAGSGGGEP